jgi:hypothetical protein
VKRRVPTRQVRRARRAVRMRCIRQEVRRGVAARREAGSMWPPVCRWSPSEASLARRRWAQRQETEATVRSAQIYTRTHVIAVLEVRWWEEWQRRAERWQRGGCCGRYVLRRRRGSEGRASHHPIQLTPLGSVLLLLPGLCSPLLRPALLLSYKKSLSRKALQTSSSPHNTILLFHPLTYHQRVLARPATLHSPVCAIERGAQLRIRYVRSISSLRLHPPKDDNHINVFFSQLIRP